MSHELKEILGSPDTFLDDLLDQVTAQGIGVNGLYMDHICYRVATIEEYDKLRNSLLDIGKLLSNKSIGGRPISVIELTDAYRYNDRIISIIELPSPKKDSPYLSGYEHVEFVIKESLESFIERYPQIEFDQKGMKKDLNRDIRLSLNRCAVKFHEQSLKEVIEIENA